MNQLLEDMNNVMQDYMVRAAISTACMMMLELMFTTITQENERLKKALGHAPTEENWRDYWQLLDELVSSRKSCQRAEDQEKIRRLVFQEGSSNTKTR